MYTATITAVDRAPYGNGEIITKIDEPTLGQLACHLDYWRSGEPVGSRVAIAVTDGDGEEVDLRHVECEPDQLWDWIEARHGKEEADNVLRQMGHEVTD